MPDLIQLLPDSVANQIAAGEVVQRPASVVKELVENALDAGATDIRVIVKDAGRTLIQVIDNGIGMSETDARIAFDRHATSKIKSADDLFAIRTMGFRGEALASIAAIAHVELRTRSTDSDLGTQIVISGSKVESQKPIACDKGSNFIIRDLFYNVPARRRFLKSNATELRYIISEMHRVALANPEIAFILVHNDQPLLNLKSENHRQRIEAIAGKQSNKQHIPVNIETSVVYIHGFIGTPQGARKTVGNQYFFVNKRYMRHSYLHKAVMDAYSNLIPSDAYPSYYLYLDIAPEMIDVNIHPTKTEIKFEDEQLIWKILNSAIRESLGKHSIVPSIDFDTEGQIDIPVTFNPTEVKPPQISFNPDYNPFRKESNYNRPQSTLIPEWQELYKGFEKGGEITLPDDDEEEEILVLPSKGNEADIQTSIVNFEHDRPVEDATFFQIKNKYILTPVRSGLMVIDQRRAHERVLFERFINTIRSGKSATQQLLFPEILHPDTDDAVLMRDIMEDLGTFGFDIKETEPGIFAVSGIPDGFDKSRTVSFLDQLLEAYKSGEKDASLEMREQLAAIMARNACMMAGERLSAEEMTMLVAQLFQCNTPAYTSSGKRVFTIVENEEIEKWFR
jgi:DNA mismatch repair protein MutL